MAGIAGKKVLFHTLGCKLNFAESSSVGKRLLAEGYHRVSDGEVADVCVVNTCSVTDLADKKSRQAIQKLVRQHPGAFVVVTGCYAQLKPEEVAKLEGVNLVLGSNEKERLPEYLQDIEIHVKSKIWRSSFKDIVDFMPSWSQGDRTRCFLKVQDGCNYFCSFCTIPKARGKSRSASVEDTVAEAKEAVKGGAREIVLTGVNIGDFGQGKGESFFDLIQAIDRIEGLERVRISSIEPNLLTDDIIAFVAQSSKFMPYFHIPLQSGSDAVLELMRRRYDTALFEAKVKRVRQLIPDAFIGVDVIVGTRGETETYFEEGYRFIKRMDISQLHVFTYSEREGTAALKIEHCVKPEEKKRRSELMHNLSELKHKEFCAQYAGMLRPVLWEKQQQGELMGGFTDNYIRVETSYNPDWVNRVVDFQLPAYISS